MIAAMGFGLQPAHAACWNDGSVKAAKVMHLNNMLMVSALRCRSGAHNFLPEYNGFIKSHGRILAGVHGTAKRHFIRTVGSKRASLALDRFNISLANRYGSGHPTMGCKQIKQVMLSIREGAATQAALVNFADQHVGEPRLPGGSCQVQIASGK